MERHQALSFQPKAELVRLINSPVDSRQSFHQHEGQTMAMALRAQAGERDAAEWLYRRFESRVYTLMCRIVGRQDAEDLSQQCFLSMLRRIGGFAGKATFWTWFYRLCVNEALQYLRKKSKRPVPAADIESLCVARCESLEHRDAIEQALKRLSHAQRVALKLHFRDGLSYKDISETLRIPIGTVGSRINQAKSAMAKSLNIDSPPAADQKSIRAAA